MVGFAGTVLIFAPWHRSGLLTWGALALLAAAASYAVAFAYMARKLTSGQAPLAYSTAQLLMATAWTTLSVPVAGPVDADLTALGAVTALGILGTGVTFYLNYRLIADEGPTTAATVGYLLPVVSVALGAMVLDERVGLRVLTGMAVVLTGIALTHLGARGTARPAPTDPQPKNEPSYAP
ncbi:DMT family transporter [Streptomyces shaanxiensis]